MQTVVELPSIGTEAYVALLPLRTERLTLTPPTVELAPAISDFATRNASHLARWSPRRPEDYDTVAAWVQRVQAQSAALQQGASLNLFVALRTAPHRVLGHVGLSNIVRGAFQAAHLGYSIDAEHEGQGLMRETVEAVLDFAFGPMRLHRVMANHLPENLRSAALLRRLGFEVEGHARDYLHIDGEWRDHVLTSKVAPTERA